MAALPLIVVVVVNWWCLCCCCLVWIFSFLESERWGGASVASVSGVWSVLVALAMGIAVLVLTNRRRLTGLRETVDAGATASVLPVISVASLVGFGAVVAAMPAFAVVRDWVLSIGGGPLVSLALATNILAALTGSASGGLTIALEALGGTVHADGRGSGYRSRADAPRRGDRRGHARQPAAQWRGGDAACRVRRDAQARAISTS